MFGQKGKSLFNTCRRNIVCSDRTPSTKHYAFPEITEYMTKLKMVALLSALLQFVYWRMTLTCVMSLLMQDATYSNKSQFVKMPIKSCK